jgi:hypothetical protein
MMADSIFRKALGERWVGVDSAQYNAERRVFNGAIDRRPYGIAFCRSTAEVVKTLEIISAHGLRAVVRSTGHNVAGRGVVDGAVTIDIRGMRGVDIDPEMRSARVQGGATWGDFDRAAQRWGLAAPGGTVSTTGVGGLTLGGGVGWLLPRYGLACDSLRSAHVLTTTGEELKVSDEREPGLAAVLRGGGYGLGVVTEFHFDLHPVDSVVGGALTYEFNDARLVLRFLAERLPTLPTSLMVSPCLRWILGSLVLELDLVCCEHQAAARFLADLATVARPATDEVNQRPYCEMQSFLDAPARRGMPSYWTSCFIDVLSLEWIDELLDAAASAPTTDCMIMIEHYHGRYRAPGRESVFPHREQSINILMVANWPSSPAGLAASSIAWAKTSLDSLNGDRTRRSYLNYVSDDSAAPSASSVAAERISVACRQLDPAGMLTRP